MWSDPRLVVDETESSETDLLMDQLLAPADADLSWRIRRTPSPDFFADLSPLREAYGLELNAHSPPQRTITAVSAYQFTTVDSNALHGSSPSSSLRHGTATGLRPNLDRTKSRFAFTVLRRMLRKYLQEFRQLVPLKTADATGQEANIQDSVSNIYLAYELAKIKSMIFKLAIQLAIELDFARSIAIRGCTPQDSAFVETVDPSRDEKHDLMNQCIHISQPATSPLQLISDQAECGNQMHVSNILDQELLQQQKGLLPASGYVLASGNQTNHGGLMLSEDVENSPNDFMTNLSSLAGEAFLDYSNEFTTSQIFKNRGALKKWACDVGRRNGFVVVVKTSDAGFGGKKPRITLGCERSGYYRDMKKNTEVHQVKKVKMKGTKKCRCPFELKGKRLATDDDWTLHVICGKHNHPTVPHTTTMQDGIWIVTVMATYGENIAKFQIYSTSGIDELKEKVAKRLELHPGSFNIKHEDGEKLILIACDEALKEYVECSTSSLGNRQINLVVTNKVANSWNSSESSRAREGKSPLV